jgi:hypothetical protein
LEYVSGAPGGIATIFLDIPWWHCHLSRVQTVVETPDFVADARKAGLGPAEVSAIVDALAQNPDMGELIVGTGGARKVRFAGRGKGKSGGYRVITYFGGRDLPVFLLNVFAKNERVDLSQAERNELRKTLRDLAESYRKGVRVNVQGR